MKVDIIILLWKIKVVLSVSNINGYKINGYIDRVNLSSIQLAYVDLIYWSARSFSSRGWDGVKTVDKGHRYFRQLLASLHKGYMKIWCNIHVIIYRLQHQRISKILTNTGRGQRRTIYIPRFSCMFNHVFVIL